MSKVRGGDERSYPASEVGAAAGRSYPMLEARGGGREEQPHAGGQGVQPRGDTQRQVRGGDERSYPTSEVRGGEPEIPHTPKPEAKGGGGKEQPLFQGAVAARAQEGLEELSHVKGQEGRR